MDEMDMKRILEDYRSVVLRYEKLHAEINALLAEHDGDSKKLSEEARERYRELAHQRDEAANEMRWMEQEYLSDDDEI